jgi:hypothetical protein
MLARGLDRNTRDRIVTPLLDAVERRLGAGEREVRVADDERPLNIRVRVEVDELEQSRERLPARWGVSSPPGLSGYARARFEKTLRERLGDDLLGYDLIAFCESRAAAARLQLHFLISEDAIDSASGEAHFGDQLPR